ncbi:uncharacterized protein LOC127260497 [Andrographis paniculata]|uniref:uncharacterized protein LOC127260497 n=1 Tax=Andrographis paniculata TaxID=175694 RepID=UPI0021E76898|nr:uncharacterized protein LOC127260497 [Andrographis paniculata]
MAMAMAMDKLLFTLLLLFLLSCSAASSADPTGVNLPPPSSSALVAAEILRSRGYSLFASVIVSLSFVSSNFSGTVLAPPDFAFASATAMFLNNRRPAPRPSVTLLLYHTLKPPLVLTWPAISARDVGDELPTLYNNNCLYVFRSPYGGDVLISSSPLRNPLDAVQIRQPDLYADDRLTVHGIDGVLDPSFAARCSAARNSDVRTMEQEGRRRVNRTFLDHAMRGLRRAGFTTVAAAMAVARSEMLSLPSVTIFAVSDRNLFLKPGGFRFDFHHHVVPIRRRIADLAIGTELVTLAPNKTLAVDSVDGTLTVGGVVVGKTEVYRSRWIIVLPIMNSFDDVEDPPQNPTIVDQVSDDFANSLPPIPSAPSPAPASASDLNPSPVPEVIPVISTDFNLPEVPSPSPLSEIGVGEAPESSDSAGGQSPSAEAEASQTSVSSPAPEPAAENPPAEPEERCVVASGVEGGDLFCAEGAAARRMQEVDDPIGGHVDESKPSNFGAGDTEGGMDEDLTQFENVKLGEINVNIADDIFFYT